MSEAVNDDDADELEVITRMSDAYRVFVKPIKDRAEQEWNEQFLNHTYADF